MEQNIRRHTARTVSVTCTHCGDSDQISDRAKRRKAAEGKPHLCGICRSVKAAKVTESDVRYWQSRYTQQELNEMVGAIIG